MVPGSFYVFFGLFWSTLEFVCRYSYRVARAVRNLRRNSEYQRNVLVIGAGDAKDLGNEAHVILIGWSEKNDAMFARTENIITIPTMADVDILAEYYSLADVLREEMLSDLVQEENSMKKMTCEYRKIYEMFEVKNRI